MSALRDLLRPGYDRLPEPLRRAIQVRLRSGDWRRRGIVFVHIAKAAGTSINHALYGRFMGHPRAAEIRRYGGAAVNALPFFSVTRNPWDRLVSAYRFARRGGGVGGAAAGMRDSALYRVPEFDSFERFVREWLAGRDLRRLDNVFQPQSAFVCSRDGRLLVDHLGRVEDLAPTLAFIERHVGPIAPIARINPSGERVDYRSFYTPDLARLVGDLYREDAERFGYDF